MMDYFERERNSFVKQLGGTKSGSDLDFRDSARSPTFDEEPPELPKPPSSRPLPDETFVEPKPIKKKPAPSNNPTPNNHNRKNQDRLWQTLQLILRFLGISTEQNIDTSVLFAVANDRLFYNFDGTLVHHTDRSIVNLDIDLLNTLVKSDAPNSTVVADGTDTKVSLEVKTVVPVHRSTPYPAEKSTEIATPIAESVSHNVEIDFTESGELQLNTIVEEEQFAADAVLNEIPVDSDRLEELNSDNNPSLDALDNQEIITNISPQEPNGIVSEQSQTEQPAEQNVDDSNTNENTNQGDSSVVEEETPISEEESPALEEEPPVSEENPPVSEEEPPVSEEEPPVSEEEPPVSEENPPVSEENPPVSEENPPVSEENPPVSEENPPVSEENPPDETDDTIIDASGGNKTIIVEAGEKVVITNFIGIGTGTNPSQAILEELDTVQFIGEGLEAESLLFLQEGEDLVLSFEGETSDTSVVLQGVQLEDIDNIPFNSEDNSAFVGNILFDSDVVMGDSFDVFNAGSNHQSVFSLDTVTFLNSLNNDIQGFDASEDVINAGQGNDRLEGLSGDDLLRGEEGNDTLLGGLGDDKLVGGSGDDLLDGGTGNNTYTGGAGRDQFMLSEESTNTITDFTSGEDQLILPDNFPINDLQIELGTSSEDGSLATIISSSSGNNLAILSDIHPDSISESDFGFLNDSLS
ncbi:MAG: calcium-binding protein [Symploca sp. SIO2G7]|nr:calcium-binding protein [Symploca sp. SIO2G7]